MIIRSVHVQHYRSIESAGLPGCEGLNVLIGKNNAGKSNLLTAIALVLSHLRQGKIAAPWNVPRPEAEFHQRESSRLARIAVEFGLSPEVNQELRNRLLIEAPHLDRSIEQIGSHNSVSFILAGAMEDSDPYLFLEQMTVGRLLPAATDLSIEGIRLLSVDRRVGFELFHNVVSGQTLARDLEAIDEIRSARHGPPLDYILQQPKERRAGYFRDFGYRYSERIRPELIRQLETSLSSATTVEEIQNALSRMTQETQEKIEAYETRETEGTISAFAGAARVPPAYASWLMQQVGSTPMLHVREVKQPIGREEADTLLRLKVRRKGPERLQNVQRTVKALLGVSLDAFESEARGERRAELDVDDFLVEANGAGVREALRLILDLELKNPRLVLIEEPEVHLHPGLARVVASYLKEKSQDIQMFVTTHSTDFVDFVPFQRVFLVSRDTENDTTSRPVDADEASLRIPAELGLRLSTVFMFDRLVFLEGPTDEAVLREFAKKRVCDLAKSNVGFVYMQGARNFAHFAADATLDLLSRRQIRIHFVVDRDERDDAEVKRMLARLGQRAALKVFQRREIENYLLDPGAITRFIAEKLRLAGSDRPCPDRNEVENAITEEAVALKDEVIRLRIENRILKPIYLHTRSAQGSLEERLEKAVRELTARQAGIEKESQIIREEVEASWPAAAANLAPGSMVLDRLARRFGVRFLKDKGDSERLARLLPDDLVPEEIADLLHSITAP